MKFGISNLSWNLNDDSKIRKYLIDYDYIETVFSKIDYGYYSTQSIFYGSKVQSFDDVELTLQRINFVIDECEKYGVKIIVFGSPSLRKGSKKNLIEVFKSIDLKLKDRNIFLCVEPNSSYYGGEYYFSLDEIVDDIQFFTNIKTMIDSHNLILEDENLFDQYEKYHTLIKHCHFSEKDLIPIKDYSLYYKFVDFLKNNYYNYGITYELKLTNNIIDHCKKFIELKTKSYVL
jgi:sugar phosphate isomerase/epimerase